jgi:hypothetical protein
MKTVFGPDAAIKIDNKQAPDNNSLSLVNAVQATWELQ